MKVTPKILILMVLFAIFSVAVFRIQVESQGEVVALYMEQVTAQKEVMIRSLIDVYSSYFQSQTLDYTYGDDMVDFAAAPDPGWAEINLSVLIDFYRANAVWIYNAGGQPVYQTHAAGHNAIIHYAALTPRVKLILDRQQFIRFYIPTSLGLVEVHGASIHGTADKDRKQAPGGYLFIGKLWDRDFIRSLEKSSECRISFHYSQPVEMSGGSNRIINIPLVNPWGGQPVAWLKASVNFSRLGELGDYVDRQFYLFAALMVAGFLLMAFLLLRWIVMPVRRISAMLEGQHLSIGSTPHPSKNEFREITSMIEDFIGQGMALRRSEERFRLLTESTSAAIFIHDGQSIDIMNPVTGNTFGYTPKELRKMHVATLIHPDDRDKFLAGIENLDSGREKSSLLELRFVRKDGESRWAQMTSVVIEMDDNRAFLVTAYDIHDRVTMEKELIRARELAEHSDRLKTAFLANLSHEFRTPMNAILGFTALLQKEQISRKEIGEYSLIIQAGTKRLMRLIDNIIEISKIETGQVDLNPAHFAVDDLLAELGQEFEKERLNQGKTELAIEWVKTEDGGHREIFADRAKLRQVLVLLLDNALKFTRSGWVRFGLSDKKTGVSEFFVSDTGIGISVEFKEQIFKHFSQESYSNARMYSGTGLGLAIARSLISLMGGQIWFDSVPGRGTTFYFSIPVPVSESKQHKTAVHTPSFDFTGRTILVVDDELINVKLLGVMLEAAGACALLARNGLEALSMIDNNPEISVVLMDIQMPGMDGLECTREILHRRPGLPVITQSASAHQDEIRHCFAAGCVDHLIKPIAAEILYLTIARHLT